MFDVRKIISFVVIVVFFVYFFASGIGRDAAQSTLQLISSSSKDTFPDFSQYVSKWTLGHEEFPIDDQSRRVIIVGDIHGSRKPLHKLLAKLSYDKRSDVLVHVGDIIAKGNHKDSLKVLSYMTSNNITGVRGNHDQKVLEWRAWMDWIASFSGGASWLQSIDDGPELEEADQEEELKGRNGKWWKKIPKGWKLYSDHYRLARDMTKPQYAYLRSLPLVLHVPSAHAFIAHAGVLPSDPNFKSSHRRQPLARLPTLPKGHTKSDGGDDSQIRLLQEEGILKDVPQNRDAWVTLNMRGVKKDGSVTREKSGTPWADLWNGDMERCKGLDASLSPSSDSDDEEDVEAERKKATSLPCLPSSVIYGHAASRGLDVNRWSLGLDSGCVYGRRLTALVLGGDTTRSYDDLDDDENYDDDDGDAAAETQKSKKHSIVSFGDDGRGRIVSVRCH